MPVGDGTAALVGAPSGINVAYRLSVIKFRPMAHLLNPQCLAIERAMSSGVMHKKPWLRMRGFIHRYSYPRSGRIPGDAEFAPGEFAKSQ